jgi:hypothetical protein
MDIGLHSRFAASIHVQLCIPTLLCFECVTSSGVPLHAVAAGLSEAPHVLAGDLSFRFDLAANGLWGYMLPEVCAPSSDNAH